ncbi:MFS transporter [Saccharothrix sp. AJ9571]|nr:MFS transporter [Saccharothrix sp. AJ9571]
MAAVGTASAARQRPGYALAVIVAAQLLVVLDASVVNIALPAAQAELGMADSSRQWVVTGYSLAFGGLLLLGGRVADVLGRKRTFLAGLVGFTVASAVGGFAVNEAMLLMARAAQGVAAAFLAPAGLAILTTVFPDGPARARAFVVFGAAVGSGGVAGMVLGGVLTSLGSWRWCLLVNLPLGVAVLIFASRVLLESKSVRPAGYDVLGTVTATLGSGALIYGIAQVADGGWLAPATLGPLLGGLALLVVFVLTERRTAEPIMPLRLVVSRVRGSAFAIILLVNAAAYACYLLLTYYLQVVRELSALATGLAFVPIGLGILGGSAAAGRALARWRPWQVTGTGLGVALAGMCSLGLLEADVPFWSVILPAQLVIGVGLGATLTTVVSLALHGVEPDQSGVASALTNAMREIGGAAGISLLNVVAIAVTATQPDPRSSSALSAGYVVAFLGAAVLLAAALLFTAWGSQAARKDRARAEEPA